MHAWSCLATENQTQPHGGIEGKIALNEHTSLRDSGNTTKSTSFDWSRHDQHFFFSFSILNVFVYKFGVKSPFPEVSVATKSHFYAKLSNIS